MDASHWAVAAVTAAIAAIAGSGLGAWLKGMYQTWHDNRRKERKDAWDRQGDWIDKLDKHMDRLQAEQQRAFEAEAVCRQEMARLRAMGRWLYDLLVKHHEALEKLDPNHVEDLPDFPDFGEEWPDDKQREFRQRSLRHSGDLLREQIQQLKDPGSEAENRGSHDPPG